ncbi:MAG TPA: hypothetical protein VGH74_05635 [Planctomycetaceae bacterium]|jgi:hypothetical protein
MAASALASVRDAVVAPRRSGVTVPGDILRTIDRQALWREQTASWLAESTVINRRDTHRIPCEIAAVLCSVDDRDEIVRQDPLSVLIADLSKSGVGIVHHQQLPHRLAQIEYELASGDFARLLVRLKWCRFKGPRRYESGGQILRVL